MRLFSSTKSRGGVATLGLAMLSLALVIVGCDTTVNEEGDPVSVSDTTDASTTINNPPPSEFDAVGTVTGRVFDAVTKEPVEGATVSLFDTLSATTGADGSFAIDNVPANASDQGNSTDYNVHISTPDGSPYRDAYTAEVPLYFGHDDGGSGSANNLASSVSFPLRKVATVTGTTVSGADVPLDSVVVRAYQDIKVNYNGSSAPTSSNTVNAIVGRDTTGEEGMYTLSGVATGTSYSLTVECVLEACGAPGESASSGQGTIPGSLVGDEVEIDDLDLSSTTFSGQLPSLTATLTPAPSAQNPNPSGAGSGTEYTENASSFNENPPTWTLTFSRPIAIADTTALEGLVEDNVVANGTATTKSLNEVGVDANVVNATTIEWTAEAELPDGINFEVDYNSLLTLPSDRLFGTGLASVNGVPVTNGNLAGSNNFSGTTFWFNTAFDTEGLDAPNVSIEPNDGVNDYDRFRPEFDLTIDEPSDSAKTFIVEARTAKSMSARAQSDWFQIEDIDAGTAAFGEINTTIDIDDNTSATFDEYAFVASDGSYRGVDIRVRAKNVNNVDGSNTSAIAFGDSTRATVTELGNNANAAGDNSVTFDVSEPLSNVNAGNFELYDSAPAGSGSTRDVINSASVSPAGPTGQTTVTVTLDDGDTFESDDVLRVTTDVTDLAGNDFSDADQDLDIN